LIEGGRRTLTAPILLKLAKHLEVDLKEFSTEADARLLGELMEVFGDPLFEEAVLTQGDVQELVESAPNAARSVLTLYSQYQATRERAQTLAARLADDDALAVERPLQPGEEVSDLIDRHGNHFPALEAAAERLHQDGGLADFNRYERLRVLLERDHGIRVQVVPGGQDLRRYDPDERLISISEVLPPRSRHFQLAHQVGLITERGLLDELAADPKLSSDASRALARVALANYFAGAVLMPYERFLRAAQTTRYDIEAIGHRFRVSFEQVCHRLTCLRRPGAEGIPFHFQRVDIAGNVSKRLAGSGIRFARYSGGCPRWNVFRAFLTPGTLRTQVSQFTDGSTYFCVARTVRSGAGGYHAPQSLYAVGIGCAVRYADQLVYADGVDLSSKQVAVPVGITCRLCERMDCAQRAFPAVQAPLQIDENRRGVSFYSPPGWD